MFVTYIQTDKQTNKHTDIWASWVSRSSRSRDWKLDMENDPRWPPPSMEFFFNPSLSEMSNFSYGA